MRHLLRTALGVAVCAALAGCHLFEPHGSGRSPLAPLQPSPESVGLEIFSARFASTDGSINGELWNEVDEQQLPSELRRQLAQSGFRVGVVGVNPPAILARLLKLAGEPVSPEEKDKVDVGHEPLVTARALFTQVGWRNEVIASKTFDQLSLLERDGDQVTGRTYPKAEGRLALKAFTESDGRVAIELTPELHYGEQQQKWSATDGVLRPESFRPKKTYEHLRLRVPLAPGQMLIMSCLPDRTGSVGYYFFTEPSGEESAQKLVLIRIAQAGQDSSFAKAQARRLDEVIKE